MGGRTWKYWPASGPVFKICWLLSCNKLFKADTPQRKTFIGFTSRAYKARNNPWNFVRSLYLQEEIFLHESSHEWPYADRSAYVFVSSMRFSLFHTCVQGICAHRRCVVVPIMTGLKLGFPRKRTNLSDQVCVPVNLTGFICHPSCHTFRCQTKLSELKDFYT